MMIVRVVVVPIVMIATMIATIVVPTVAVAAAMTVTRVTPPMRTTTSTAPIAKSVPSVRAAVCAATSIRSRTD